MFSDHLGPLRDRREGCTIRILMFWRKRCLLEEKVVFLEKKVVFILVNPTPQNSCHPRVNDSKISHRRFNFYDLLGSASGPEGGNNYLQRSTTIIQWKGQHLWGAGFPSQPLNPRPRWITWYIPVSTLYIHTCTIVYQYLHVHTGMCSCQYPIILCQHPAHKLLSEHCSIHYPSTVNHFLQSHPSKITVYSLTWYVQVHTSIYTLHTCMAVYIPVHACTYRYVQLPIPNNTLSAPSP